jgi:hypothetical protein
LLFIIECSNMCFLQYTRPQSANLAYRFINIQIVVLRPFWFLSYWVNG